MKKKSGKLPNNKKKSFGITFVTYSMVIIGKLLRNCMMKCCLLIVKVRTLLNFCSKTVTCNAIAQKILKRINYQPIQLSNASIHLKEHIEVNNYF